MKHPLFRFDSALLIVACVLAPAHFVMADGPGPTTLLEELNRDTLSLYRQVEPGIVRVQLPMTRPSDSAVLTKWQGVLSPAMRDQLEHEVSTPASGMARAQILPTTRPEA